MQTVNLLEDAPILQEPMLITQIKKFLEKDTNPLLFLNVIYHGFPFFKNTYWNGKTALLQHMAEMRLLQQIEKEHQVYKDNIAKAAKPAELYRKYAQALRAVKENGRHQDTRTLAGEKLNELFLAQSLPASELETPDWIDPYTGELDPTYDPDFALDSLADLQARIEMVSPLSEEQYARALALKEELGWNQAQVEQFLRAQSGNDGFDGDPDEFFDDREYVPPTGERNLTIDKAAFALATPAIAEFNRWRTNTFTNMKANGTNGQTWLQCFLDLKSESSEVADLVNTIAEVANSYDVTTAAAIALKIDGDYGLNADDLAGIVGFTLNEMYYDLNAYIKEWGDDVLEIMQDGLSSSPTSDIGMFDEDTLKQLTSLLPEKHHNPMQTQSYVMNYLEAVMGGATLGEAENSAIAAWREAMSPAGAKAYAAAWANAPHKAPAWRAFWQKCGPDVPRPQEHIKAVRGNYSGLILASGRKIDWNIAAMKFKNNELAITPEQKEKLRTLLTQKGMRNCPVLKYV